MGLLKWFKKIQTKQPRRIDIFNSAEIDHYVNKAKRPGGDPFYKYRQTGTLPEKYEFGMNCFMDTVEPDLRQAVYEEIKKTGGITDIITVIDGVGDYGLPTLFSVNFGKGMDALNKAAKEGYVAFKVDLENFKKGLVRMMVDSPDEELSFLTDFRGKQAASHATKWKVKDIVLESDKYLTQGAKFHKNKEYKHALEFYDKAIEVEPLDARAWLNKGTLFTETKNYNEALRCLDKTIEIAPEIAGGAVWVEKAEILHKLKDYNKAISCCDKALEINPKKARAWNGRASSLVKLERYKEALESFNKAAEFLPSEPIIWRNKADILWLLERYDESIRCCDKALAIDANMPAVWNIKGICLIKRNKYRQAIESFDKALANIDRVDEQDVFVHEEVWMHKAEAFEKLKEYENAIACLDKAINLSPRNSTHYSTKGAFLIFLERYDEAINCCNKALEIDPQCEAAKVNKDIAVKTKQSHAENESVTLEFFQKNFGIKDISNFRKKPDEPIARYAERVFVGLFKNLSNQTSLDADGYAKEIGKIIHVTASIEPTMGVVSDPKDFFRFLGFTHKEGGDTYFRFAVLAYGEIGDKTAIGPLINIIDHGLTEALAHPKILEDKALAERIKKDFPALKQEALMLLKKLTGQDFGDDIDKWYKWYGKEEVTLKPDSARAWYLKGRDLYDNHDAYEEAIKAFDKALEIEPDHPGALDYKVRALQGLCDYEGALKAVDELIKSSPLDEYFAWYSKGKYLYNLGRYEEAIKALDKAIELKPDYEPSKNCRARCMRETEPLGKEIVTLKVTPEIITSLAEQLEEEVYVLHAERAIEINRICDIKGDNGIMGTAFDDDGVLRMFFVPFSALIKHGPGGKIVLAVNHAFKNRLLKNEEIFDIENRAKMLERINKLRRDRSRIRGDYF